MTERDAYNRSTPLGRLTQASLVSRFFRENRVLTKCSPLLHLGARLISPKLDGRV